MSRHRKIDIRMWGDAKFRALSKPRPCAQWLWVYLLTGPHTSNLPGLFHIGEAALAEALEWSVEDFRKVFLELSTKGMLETDWSVRIVYIPNAIRYNSPESPNVILHWRNAWEEMPECSLKDKAKVDYWQHVRTLDQKGKAFREAFRKVFGEALEKKPKDPFGNQEQEQEQEQDTLASQTKLPPILPGYRSSLPADNPELAAVAKRIVKHYQETVGAPHTERGGQQAVIDQLQFGRSEDALKNAAAGYAEDCRSKAREAKYRESVKVFYSEGTSEQFLNFNPRAIEEERRKLEEQRRIEREKSRPPAVGATIGNIHQALNGERSSDKPSKT